MAVSRTTAVGAAGRPLALKGLPIGTYHRSREFSRTIVLRSNVASLVTRSSKKIHALGQVSSPSLSPLPTANPHLSININIFIQSTWESSLVKYKVTRKASGILPDYIWSPEKTNTEKQRYRNRWPESSQACDVDLERH